MSEEDHAPEQIFEAGVGREHSTVEESVQLHRTLVRPVDEFGEAVTEDTRASLAAAGDRDQLTRTVLP